MFCVSPTKIGPFLRLEPLDYPRMVLGLLSVAVAPLWGTDLRYNGTWICDWTIVYFGLDVLGHLRHVEMDSARIKANQSLQSSETGIKKKG